MKKAAFCFAFSLWSLAFSFCPCFADALLYCRLTDGFWQIWKETEGGKPEQLTASPHDKRLPTRTSSGEILYHSNNDRCFLLTEEGKEKELLKELWPVRDLIASPKEELFVFSRFRTDLVDQSNLWLYDPKIEKKTMLTQEEGVQYQSSWSPDGTQIAYSGGSGPRSKEIFVIRKDGTEKKKLTQNQDNDFMPAWSPDATKIAYSSNVTGDFEIWLMNADGGEPRQLTDSPGLDTRPVFSPDGTQIAFTSNRSGGLEIWVMNADGSNPRKWLGEAPACDPFWF